MYELIEEINLINQTESSIISGRPAKVDIDRANNNNGDFLSKTATSFGLSTTSLATIATLLYAGAIILALITIFLCLWCKQKFCVDNFEDTVHEVRPSTKLFFPHELDLNLNLMAFRNYFV